MVISAYCDFAYFCVCQCILAIQSYESGDKMCMKCPRQYWLIYTVPVVKYPAKCLLLNFIAGVLSYMGRLKIFSRFTWKTLLLVCDLNRTPNCYGKTWRFLCPFFRNLHLRENLADRGPVLACSLFHVPNGMRHPLDVMREGAWNSLAGCRRTTSSSSNTLLLHIHDKACIEVHAIKCHAHTHMKT